MKIWILTSETPFNQPGGIARYVHNFATYLGTRGHAVTVVCRDTEDSCRAISHGYCLRTFRTGDLSIPQEFPFSEMSYWPAVSYQYADYLENLAAAEGPPDIIESQEYMGIAYFLLQKRLVGESPFQKVPVVLNLHSPEFILRRVNEEPRYELPVYWHGQMEKFCLHAADRLICPSHYMRDQILQMPELEDLSIDVMPLPWSETPSVEAASLSTPPDIIYHGRLELRKGVLQLVEQCALLWEAGHDFTLELIGSDTPYTPKNTTIATYLKNRYSKWLEAGYLRIPGAMEHSELLRRLTSARVSVIPSLWENFPNTCIEAMSLGRVVLASVHGGQTEMIGSDSAAGLLFDWNVAGDFSTKLLEALAMSDQQRQDMGAKAISRIAEICHPDLVIPKRLAHFEAAIKAQKISRTFPFLTPLHPIGKSSTPATHPFEPGLLSVIIPFYNLGAFIEETVASVVRSSYELTEILIINDGSTDPDSLDVLNKLRASAIPNLRIIDQPNQGLPRTRNNGVTAARGEFVLLLDADDLIEPTFASKAIEVLRRFDNVDLVYSWVRYFGAIESAFIAWNLEFPFLLGHNMMIPLCVIRRSAFMSHGLNKPTMQYGLEDYESWIGILKAGCGGVCLPELLTRYRVRKDSMLRSLNTSQLLHLYETITTNHPELYARYGEELFHLQNANGPAWWWDSPSAPIQSYQLFRRQFSDGGEQLKLMQRDLEWNVREVAHLNNVIKDLRSQLKAASPGST